MENHPIVTLIQKIESHYPKELLKYFSASKKQRLGKLYLLINSAKNEEQRSKELLFKKIFAKPYTEKNDYLWRNEIRLLKEELEQFLLQKEHYFLVQNNTTYKNWLLIHAFDKLKFIEGMDEKHETLLKEKDDFASYAFVLDACMLQLQNLHYKITDLTKRLNQYPTLLGEAKNIFIDLVSAYNAKLNNYKAHYNWIAYNHQNEYREELVFDEQHFILTNNPISNFFNSYTKKHNLRNERKGSLFCRPFKIITWSSVIASFIISAAVPCMGLLIALRSAKPRIVQFPALISRK